MITENYNGIVEDPRSEEDKAKDYKYEDLAMGEIKLNWKEYNDTDFQPFEIQNQDGSGSCVAQGTSKILAMHEVKEGKTYKRLCPKFIYTRRENYPEMGMWLPNALEIAVKQGTCQEEYMPCDNKGESFMNDKTELAICKEKAADFKGKAYFTIDNKNIDKIAEVIEQGYGILMGFRFDYDEWVDVPFINPSSALKCGHGVAGTKYCLYKGEKAIMIEDSWGPHYGKGGVRIITETFLKARCFYAGYITSLEDVKFIFTKTLKMGSKGLDVKMLQKKLGAKIDGVFGRDTKSAVIAFQLAHLLVPDGIVGPLTNKELNK